MNRLFHLPTHLALLKALCQWSLLSVPVAVAAGSASALFLWALDWVTRMQWSRPELLYALPVAGVAVGFLYHFLGKNSDQGSNLLIDEIHTPGGGVPLRMAPLVLIGTLVTHLFGGSAGREGTALQMGGGLAGGMARWFRLRPETTRIVLLCGIAAGFGSVFGTPLTGAIFAMEVLVIGRIQHEAVIPVLIASIVGDATCTAWGATHAIYHLPLPVAESVHGLPGGLLLLKVAGAGICFGLAAFLFCELCHLLQRGYAKLIPFAPLRPALAGVVVIMLTLALGTRDYLGLGADAPPGGHVSIAASFSDGGSDPFSWLWKSIFTAVTVSGGLKGGEVTPLFFIGSTLGNSLAHVLAEPVALFAALGFVAVFAGAANTPLACTVMGVELFGGHYTLHFAVACFVAYLFSGPSGIYRSQRSGVLKGNPADGRREVIAEGRRELDRG